MDYKAIATKEVIAMLCITALAIVALINEVNSYIYSLAIIAVSGIGGYQIARYRAKKSNQDKPESTKVDKGNLH